MYTVIKSNCSIEEVVVGVGERSNYYTMTEISLRSSRAAVGAGNWIGVAAAAAVALAPDPVKSGEKGLLR